MEFLIENKFFFFCLTAAIFVIAIIIFVSTITPSAEQFIEVYWELFNVENLFDKSYVPCNLKNCSMSGIYKIGNFHFNDTDYGLVVIDPESPNRYDSICIDFNQDESYCDEGEGPMKELYTFSIGNDFFSIFNLRKDRVIIAHSPKDITTQKFKIGFVIESHYKNPVNLDVNLLVNETLKQAKNLSLDPGQKTIQTFTVTLPEDGLYKIKISVIVLPTEEEIFIDFLVNKYSSQ